MLEKAFELAVVISAVDRFTGPTQQIAKQLGMLDKQTAVVQKRLAGFKAMTIAGGAITGIGALMALGLNKAVDSAGELQTAVMGVKEALKLTNDEYQKAMNLSQTVGLPTIFNAVQVSGIMQAMATSGLNKQQVLDPSILRQYVNFADVQAQIKHENAPDVVSAAVNMAHQYQLYSTAQLTPFLNELNAALLHTHETADEFATTYKYVANQARSQGMNSADTLAATAWLGRMGFGNGRGGTNFADFLQRSIYHSSGTKADAAMQAAGFVQNGHSVFEDAKGNFVGIPASVQIMQNFAKRFNNNTNVMDPLLHAIFGTQGARVAMMMTSKGAADQYTNIQQQIAGTATIDQTQGDLNNTWQGKVKQLKTTLQDIGQAFGKSVMPVLLPLVKALDDILGRVLIFEQQHPKIMKWISTFASIATAVMLVVGPLMLLTGAIGYLATSRSVVIGMQLLGKSFTGMLGPLALVAGAIYLLHSAWITDFGHIRERTAGVFNWIKQEIPVVMGYIHQFLQLIGVETVSHKNVGMGQRFSAGLETIRSFHMPNWVKWAAGLLLARKGFDMLNGGVLKTVSTVKSLRKLMGEGSLLGRLGKGALNVLDSGMGRALGRGTWTVGKTVGTALGKHGVTLARLTKTGIGKVWSSQTLRTAGRVAMGDFAMVGKGVGKGAAFLGKAALNDLKWLGTNIPRLAKSFGSLAMSVGRSTIAFTVNAARTIAVKTAQVAVTVATKLWSAAQVVLNAVLDGNPIVLIIAGLVALGLAVYEVIKHWKQISTFFEGLWHEAVSWGANIVTGLWNGIKGMWTWLKQHIMQWIDDVIPGPIRKALGINSPSRLMAQYGKYTAQGLANGMIDNSHLVKHAANQLAGATVAGISGRVGVGDSSQTVHLHEGAIQIYGADQKQSGDIVDEMFRRLGTKARMNNLSRPMKPGRIVFN